MPPLPRLIRRKHLPRDWRAHVHALHYTHGWTGVRIASKTGIPQATVARCLRQTIKPTRQDNAPRVLPQAVRAMLAKACLQDVANRDRPFQEVAAELGILAPRAVIRRSLEMEGLGRFWRRIKPKTSPRIRAERLAWARRFYLWDVNEWKNVIFADEAAFQIGAGNRRNPNVTRRRGQPLDPEAVGRDEMGSGRTTQHYWGAINWSAHCELVRWDSRVTGQSMNAISWKERVWPTLSRFRWDLEFMGLRPRLAHDNASTHTARVTRDTITQSGLVLIKMPAHSPDLQPMENIWAWVKNKVRRMHWIETGQQLEDALNYIWNDIPVEVVKNSIESMPSRILAVIDGQGYPTKY